MFTFFFFFNSRKCNTVTYMLVNQYVQFSGNFCMYWTELIYILQYLLCMFDLLSLSSIFTAWVNKIVNICTSPFVIGKFTIFHYTAAS